MSCLETVYTRFEETWTPLFGSTSFRCRVLSSARGCSWLEPKAVPPAFSQHISVAPAGLSALLRVLQPQSLTWCNSCVHGEGQGLVQITCITKQKAALKNEDNHQNSPPSHAAFFFLKVKAFEALQLPPSPLINENAHHQTPSVNSQLQQLKSPYNCS